VQASTAQARRQSTLAIPKKLEERIGAGHAAPVRSFRHRALRAKTKLRDDFDLHGTWVHG
jgi:hypothetical protein